MSSKNLRLEDIAKIAGVSKATVSMVLNDRKGVGDGTRRRVLDVVAKQGYVPKSLIDPSKLYASRTIRFVAFATDDIVGEAYGQAPFFAEVLHGIEAESRRLGYEVAFASLRSLADFERVVERNQSLGCVVLGTNVPESLIRDVVALQSNTVVLDTSFDFVDANFVVLDNAGGAFRATEHLIGMGHRRIGYLEAHTRIQNFEQRKRGFLTALERHGLTLDAEDAIVVPPDAELAQQALERHARERSAAWPSAFFCESDYIALGAVKALRAVGVDVPRSVSLIGFDDIPSAAIVEPSLTTMHVDKRKMGALAVRRLVELCEAPEPLEATKLSMALRLVGRDSCAPPVPVQV